MKRKRARVRKPPSTNPPPIHPLQLAESSGWHDGYRAGSEHGYHHGRCAVVLERIPPDQGVKWGLRVLYVQPKEALPYVPIDLGIIDALRGLVAELVVCKPTDDVVGLAASIRPDVVLVLDSIHSLPIEKARAIRELGIRTAVWFTDDPYYTDVTQHIAPCYDYVFTTELTCVAFYRDLGCREVHYLPFGINRAATKPVRVGTPYRSDICFIGTAYWNRVELIDRIADYLAGKNTIIIGYWWDRLKNYEKLKDKIKLGQWMSPEETLNYFSGAKIVINHHRLHDDPTFNQNSRNIPAVSVNPRMFEIGGSGAFQLTDMRGDLYNVYTPGVDLAVYHSPEDLIGKLEHYLTHEEERRAMALNALARTVRDHTYRSRLNQLFGIVASPQTVGG